MRFMPMGRPIRPRPMSPICFVAGFKRALLDGGWLPGTGLRHEKRIIVAEFCLSGSWRPRPGEIQAVFEPSSRGTTLAPPDEAATAKAVPRGFLPAFGATGASGAEAGFARAGAAFALAPESGFSSMRTRH